MDIQEVKALKTALEWEIKAVGEQIFFTHPEIGGGMVIAEDMLFLVNELNDREIEHQLESYRKYREDIQPSPTRLLEAEKNAISNRISDNMPRPTKNLSHVFPQLRESAGLLVFSVYDCSFSGGHLEYLLLDQEALTVVKSITAALERAEGDEAQRLKNALYCLLGTTDEPHLVAEVDPSGYVGFNEFVLGELDPDGDTEYRQVYCLDCHWEHTYMYWHGIVSDYIEQGFHAWEKHHEEKPDCQGTVRGYH